MLLLLLLLLLLLSQALLPLWTPMTLHK